MTICTRTLILPAALGAILALSACGGTGLGRLNPFNWGSSSSGPETLTPDDGYAVTDPRQAFPQLTSAHWEPTDTGRMLVVTGIAPTKGWWDAELVALAPAPPGRIATDPNGTLQLVFVGAPPLPDSAAARMPADPRVDTITVARTFSNRELAQMRAVAVSGAANSLTLRP